MPKKAKTAPISCDPLENVAWKIAADKQGRSFQNWVRQTLNAAAIEQGAMLPKPADGNAVPTITKDEK